MVKVSGDSAIQQFSGDQQWSHLERKEAEEVPAYRNEMVMAAGFPSGSPYSAGISTLVVLNQLLVLNHTCTVHVQGCAGNHLGKHLGRPSNKQIYAQWCLQAVLALIFQPHQRQRRA